MSRTQLEVYVRGAPVKQYLKWLNVAWFFVLLFLCFAVACLYLEQDPFIVAVPSSGVLRGCALYLLLCEGAGILSLWLEMVMLPVCTRVCDSSGRLGKSSCST